MHCSISSSRFSVFPWLDQHCRALLELSYLSFYYIIATASTGLQKNRTEHCLNKHHLSEPISAPSISCWHCLCFALSSDWEARVAISLPVLHRFLSQKLARWAIWYSVQTGLHCTLTYTISHRPCLADAPTRMSLFHVWTSFSKWRHRLTARFWKGSWLLLWKCIRILQNSSV